MGLLVEKWQEEGPKKCKRVCERKTVGAQNTFDPCGEILAEKKPRE
jgi:hypothetical protein